MSNSQGLNSREIKLFSQLCDGASLIQLEAMKNSIVLEIESR